MIEVTQELQRRGFDGTAVALYAYFGRSKIELDKIFHGKRISPLRGRKKPGMPRNSGHDAIGKWAHENSGDKSPQWKGGPKRPEVLMAKRMRRMIGRMMYFFGTKKTDQTYKMLGYTPSELRVHLESQFSDGMSWENHGKEQGCWSIDHIRPVCSFPSDADPAEVNALSNLRPIWHLDNIRRNKRWP